MSISNTATLPSLHIRPQFNCSNYILWRESCSGDKEVGVLRLNLFPSLLCDRIVEIIIFLHFPLRHIAVKHSTEAKLFDSLCEIVLLHIYNNWVDKLLYFYILLRLPRHKWFRILAARRHRSSKIFARFRNQSDCRISKISPTNAKRGLGLRFFTSDQISQIRLSWSWAA